MGFVTRPRKRGELSIVLLPRVMLEVLYAKKAKADTSATTPAPKEALAGIAPLVESSPAFTGTTLAVGRRVLEVPATEAVPEVREVEEVEDEEGQAATTIVFDHPSSPWASSTMTTTEVPALRV